MFDLMILVVMVAFFVFIYLMYRAVKLFVKFVAFVGISALFPIIMVKVFGMDWVLSWQLIVSFGLVGVLGFFIYYGLAILEVFSRAFLDSSKDALGVDKKRRRRSEDYEE